MTVTCQCQKCGETVVINPAQINADIQLIADDLSAKLKKARKALQDIAATIEQNNEQNGFWGVAGAHGTIRQTAITGLNASK